MASSGKNNRVMASVTKPIPTAIPVATAKIAMPPTPPEPKAMLANTMPPMNIGIQGTNAPSASVVSLIASTPDFALSLTPL